MVVNTALTIFLIVALYGCMICFVTMGVRFGGKLRVVKITKGDWVRWQIQCRVLFAWIPFNTESDYWDGYYEKEEDAKSTFKFYNSKTVVEC